MAVKNSANHPELSYTQKLTRGGGSESERAGNGLDGGEEKWLERGAEGQWHVKTHI